MSFEVATEVWVARPAVDRACRLKRQSCRSRERERVRIKNAQNQDQALGN